MACSEECCHVGREGLFSKFEELGIKTETVEHPEVFTVEEMMPHVGNLPGAQCKNLFLRDKKKKLWLLSACHDREVKLADLAKKVGAPGGLRLADESILKEKLGVTQGCVTAYALINDKNGDIKFLVDDDLINDKFEKISFHPMVNSATTAITPQDFLKFLEATNHKPISVKFDS